MEKKEFAIGQEFFTASGRWRCTDIGTRTIAAIKLDAHDDNWYAGPPYGVAEFVFDENDFGCCEMTYSAASENWGETFRRNEKAKRRPGRLVVVNQAYSEEELTKLVINVLNECDPEDFEPGIPGRAPWNEYEFEAKPIAHYIFWSLPRISSDLLSRVIDGVWILYFGWPVDAAEIAHKLMDAMASSAP